MSTRGTTTRGLRRRLAAVSALAMGAALMVAIPTPASAAARVDNPYVGAKAYVNPDWSAKAAAEPGGAAIADTPAFVWMDRIAAIGGSASAMSLRDHLDTALDQGANLFQVVIYDLPGRDCAALASNGELGPTELDRYKNEYIDPISDILADPAYASLRIVTIIEPDSLPNIVTNAGGTAGSTDACATMKANGNYEKGVGYALHTLGAIPNVYNYIDAAHHGWLGWETNMGPAATEFKKAATSEGATVNDVSGFIVNTANYSALKEPNFKITDSVNGTTVRQSKWIDWNYYTDELSFAQALRTLLVSQGFNSNIGMLIDTARNGWGGTARPTGPGPLTSVDTYVNGGRVDRRIHAGNWCNQSGAGIGERPTAAPEAGIDAYVWAKPPGESDGNSAPVENDEGKGFDRMCDPTYTGNGRNGNSLTGALPNSPLAGHWFSAQFQELVRNAYPPITGGGGGDTQAPTAPTGVTATAKTSSSVSLSWTASTDNTAVTGYNVFRGGVQVGTSTSTSYTDSGLTASTAYSYTVKAKDAAGNISAASTALSVTTSAGGGGGDTQAPTAPTGVTATAKTSSSVSLSWTASTDNTAVTGYNVFRGGVQVGTSTSTSYTDSGLTASTAYSYTVKAKDAAGNISAASSALSVTTSAGGGTGTGALKAQYKNTDSSATDNQIRMGLQLVNTGTTAVDLSTVKLRYWFTPEAGSSTFGTSCDWAVVGCGTLTHSVKTAGSAAGASHYLEVSFGSGTLAAGASTGEIQMRVNKSDWSNFNEADDYSRSTSTSYADAPKVGVYVTGTLAWGTAP